MSPRGSGRMRAALAGAAAAGIVIALARPAAASLPAPARPVGHLARLQLDYETPLEYPGGRPATAPALEAGVVAASEADFSFLRYETVGDLGGFVPAPIGRYLTGTVGRAVGNGPRIPHVPFLGKAGQGIKVYGFVPGKTPRVPTTTAPAGPPPPVTTTTVVSPPTPLYIEMTNNHDKHPVIDATNMAPGDTVRETVVIGNAGTVPFDVTLRSLGDTGALARDLRLTVAVIGGPVLYSGGLDASAVPIGHLGVGQSIDLDISLHLPSSAGNALQQKSARVGLFWTGEG